MKAVVALVAARRCIDCLPSTFVRPTVGYAEGSPSAHSSPFPFAEQNREEYYRETHLQTIEF